MSLNFIMPFADLTAPERRAARLLSDLFLGVAVRRETLDLIAERLHAFGFHPDTAYTVLYHDLYPLLCWNLVNPEAEVFDFDSDWVCAKVEDRRIKRRLNQNWMEKVVCATEWVLFSRIITPQWKQIEQK